MHLYRKGKRVAIHYYVQDSYIGYSVTDFLNEKNREYIEHPLYSYPPTHYPIPKSIPPTEYDEWIFAEGEVEKIDKTYPCFPILESMIKNRRGMVWEYDDFYDQIGGSFLPDTGSRISIVSMTPLKIDQDFVFANGRDMHRQTVYIGIIGTDEEYAFMVRTWK